jgi:hypothetical protein
MKTLTKNDLSDRIDAKKFPDALPFGQYKYNSICLALSWKCSDNLGKILFDDLTTDTYNNLSNKHSSLFDKNVEFYIEPMQ